MRRALVLVGAMLSLTVPAAAQSLFNASGLGLPADPLDARALSLGNVGIGLVGGAVLPTDPAAAAGLVGATGLLSAQPSWVDFSRSDGSESGSFRGERFPLGGFAYPGPRGTVFTLSFASQLDQRYRAVRQVSVGVTAGSGDATDTLTQEGGVALVSVGVARRVTGPLSAGLTVGRYTGSVTRTLVRRLGDVDVIGDPVAFQTRGRWRYSGAQVSGGLSLELGTVARVAGSMSWSSELNAEAGANTTAPSRSYSLPLTLRLGASGVLAEGLLATASLERADWSATEDDLVAGTTASATLEYGVGLELARARVLGRQAPLRFGYRRGSLPFGTGSGNPTESVFAGGVGIALNPQTDFVLGGVDVSLERGERSDGALTETFWRANFTMRVTGF